MCLRRDSEYGSRRGTRGKERGKDWVKGPQAGENPREPIVCSEVGRHGALGYKGCGTLQKKAAGFWSGWRERTHLKGPRPRSG